LRPFFETSDEANDAAAHPAFVYFNASSALCKPCDVFPCGCSLFCLLDHFLAIEICAPLNFCMALAEAKAEGERLKSELKSLRASKQDANREHSSMFRTFSIKTRASPLIDISASIRSVFLTIQ
jgi:hypothetical protein